MGQPKNKFKTLFLLPYYLEESPESRKRIDSTSASNSFAFATILLCFLHFFSKHYSTSIAHSRYEGPYGCIGALGNNSRVVRVALNQR
jgi:hypothetical protein